MKVISQFSPKGLLKNPHIQTILPTYLSRKVKRRLHHKVFRLSDGDCLDLYFSEPSEKGMAIILHGIIGSFRSNYASFTFKALATLNLGGVFIVARGAGRHIKSASRFFNAADTQDLNEVIHYLKSRFPNIPLFAIGYSLGGAILSKWLAEHCNENILTAAMAVSLPFDMHFCAHNFKKFPGKFYSYFMLKALRKRLVKMFKHRKKMINFKLLKKVKNFPELDHFISAPLNGYRSAIEYYKKGSPAQYLKYIKTPLLIINALDDPLMSPEIVPSEKDLSEHVVLELSEHGGHLGFISEMKLGKINYWVEQRIQEYFGGFIANYPLRINDN